MATKDDKVIAKMPADEKRELVELAEQMDVPVSQIVREGVRKHVKDLLEKREVETV